MFDMAGQRVCVDIKQVEIDLASVDLREKRYKSLFEIDVEFADKVILRETWRSVAYFSLAPTS